MKFLMIPIGALKILKSKGGNNRSNRDVRLGGVLPCTEHFYHHLDYRVAKGGEPQTQDARDAPLEVGVLTRLTKELDGEVTVLPKVGRWSYTTKQRAIYGYGK